MVIAAGFVALDAVYDWSGTNVRKAAGGSCGNVAASMAALGHDVTVLTRLGCDVEADLALRDLRFAGVDTSLVDRDCSYRTPVVEHRLISHGALGDHAFSFPNGRDEFGAPLYRPPTERSMHTAARRGPPTALFFDRVDEGVLKLARLAQRAGAFVLFEPSSFRNPSEIVAAARVSTLVKFSRQRIQGYEHLIEAFDDTYQVMTLGSEGIAFRRPKTKNWSVLPPAPAEMILDTAGAGDMVSTALLHVVSSGLCSSVSHSIEAGLRAGAKLAALNCSFVGARGICTDGGASRFRDEMRQAAYAA